MIKDIFSHKVAIFIYGFITAFTISLFVTDNIYKERIGVLKYTVERGSEKYDSLKSENSALKNSVEKITGILDEINIRDLIETNKSQQAIIEESLRKRKVLEGEIQELRKKIKAYELSQMAREGIILKGNEKFIINGQDVTLLVQRISALLMKIKESGGEGLNATLNEYKSLIRELKIILPDDVMIKSIELMKDNVPEPSYYYYEEKRREIRADVETQLFLIFNYLRTKNVR